MKSWMRRSKSSSILQAFLLGIALLSVPVGSAPFIRCVQAADDAPAVNDKSADGKSTAPSNSTESNSADEKNSGSEDTTAKAANRAKTPEEKAADRKAEEEDFQFYKSLADTIDQVERNYVKPIDRRELMEAAIKGVLSKLDPYSNYIGPDDFSGFRTSVESQFGGIGIQVTPDDGSVKVSSSARRHPGVQGGRFGRRSDFERRGAIDPRHESRRSGTPSERRRRNRSHV